MATPNHPGSRVVAHRPDLTRIIRTIQAEVGRIARAASPETLQFAPAPLARGEPCTAASFADVLVTYAYRSGSKIYADLAAGTLTASAVEARFSVPDLGLVGDATASPTGGDTRIIRISLAIPDTWASGAAYRLYIQGRRTVGAEATTLRVLRAWQL